MPIIMDPIDFELCLDADQHGTPPHQPGDVDITGTDVNIHEVTYRPRRTRTFSEIEDDSTDRLDYDKRPRLLEPEEDTERTHNELDGMPEYSCQSQEVDPFFPYHGSNVQILMNPLQAMRAPEPSNGIPMNLDSSPMTGYSTHIQLEYHHSFHSEEGRTLPARFSIYEDPDGMEIDTSHIEVSHTWTPRSTCVDDDKENVDGEDGAPDESDTPQNPRVLLPFSSSNSTMEAEAGRSIYDTEYTLDDVPDYAHIQDSTHDMYRDQPSRRPWVQGEQGAVLPRALYSPSPPRQSRLSDFDADDEADSDVILSNSRHGSSVTTHDQDVMVYTYRPFSMLNHPAEIPIYYPLREIPSMSPVSPEVMPRGPRRPRRIRAFDFPL